MNPPDRDAPAPMSVMSGARWLTVALYAFVGSGLAMLAGRWLVPMLPGAPAWLVPALVIGALALALVGVACAPAAMRHLAARRRA